MEYTTICEWTGKNYSAYAPDLPGCVACGDTFDETEQLIKETIDLYIEELRHDGKSAPEPATNGKKAEREVTVPVFTLN